MPSDAPRLLLTPDDTARALAVCPRTLRELARRGELRPIALGRRCVRYAVADLQDFIRRQQDGAESTFQTELAE